MSDVVSLRGDPIPTVHCEPNQSTIDMVEGLLDDARSGKIQVFAFGAFTSDGMFKSNWNGMDNASASLIAGVLSRLNFEFNKALYDHDYGDGAAFVPPGKA